MPIIGLNEITLATVKYILHENFAFEGDLGSVAQDRLINIEPVTQTPNLAHAFSNYSFDC
jgi:hypothetical protein